MVELTIDNKKVTVPEGTTILEAAKTAGLLIPNLCYLKGINEIGACRVCVVDVKGSHKLVTSCNTPVQPGMEVRTNTPRAREARRTNIELIMSQHKGHCIACARSGNCKLQTFTNNEYFERNSYVKEIPKENWSKIFPLYRDDTKCIKCMRCVQICDKIQSLGVWDVQNTGGRTTVGVSGNRTIEEANCSLCGQCVTHCPTGALRARNDCIRDFSVYGPISQEDKIKVVQIAPAVRAAWGEEFNLAPSFATAKRLVSVLKKIGFDYVFDTNFAADLTIMEESAEVLARLEDGKHHPYPLFTSCCPGWVRFVKTEYPDMVGCLSTSKSPQQMFGVLTTRELCRLIKRENINIAMMEESEFDSPLGCSSGAGVIFGTTGGVMEAALRTAYYKLTGVNPEPDQFEQIRSGAPWREASLSIAGTKVRIAVVSGLSNTRALLEALRRGEVSYDFVEVMACPGGCVGGGGQPIHDGEEWAERRAKVLYDLDARNEIRFSHENPEIQALYKEYLKEPLSHKAEALLHTDHTSWEVPTMYEQIR